MSGETIKLVTPGRVTGLPHIVLLRFAHLGEIFFVMAGRKTSDWVLNALTTKTAKVRLGELLYDVSIRGATNEEKIRTVQHFEKKYGKRLTNEWYSASEVCLALVPEGAPRVRGAVRGEFETKVDLREWQLRKRDYYQQVSEAFDSAAEEYDFTISHNFINRWIRRRSIDELLRYVKPDDILLEIGCGTGTEAIEISEMVHKIIATDISENMIEILRKKVRSRGIDDRILPVRIGASRISRVSEFTGVTKEVRVAYSFNGALNCEPRISEFPAELSKVLRDSGYFICSVRNTLCLSEAMSHAAALQFDKMAPRKKQPLIVSVGGMDIPSTYYSPARFANFFSGCFQLKRIVGLPAILPPAYLSDYYLKLRRLIALERIESMVAPHFPFNRYGDQTLFVFQKRES